MSKMNILPSFTHVSLFLNLYESFSSVKCKKKNIWRMLLSKQLTVAINFHGIFPLNTRENKIFYSFFLK